MHEVISKSRGIMSRRKLKSHARTTKLQAPVFSKQPYDAKWWSEGQSRMASMNNKSCFRPDSSFELDMITNFRIEVYKLANHPIGQDDMVSSVHLLA